jgi:predicted PurR-regulated permease PerM
MAGPLDQLRRHRLSLFVLAIGILIAWLVWQARGALPAFFIGLALAFVLDPLVTLLQRRGVPRWGGVLVGYAIVVGLIWLLVAFALPPISNQTREFISQLPELGSAVTDVQRSIQEWYLSLPLPADVRAALDESIRSAEAAFAQALRDLLGPAVSTLLRTAGFVLGLVVIPIWLFFVLKDRERFAGAVASALPPSWRSDGHAVLTLLGRVGGRWVRGELLLGAAVFLATAVGLTLLSLAGFAEFGEFTLVLAVIAGVLEWFPVVGPIVAAIPAVLIGLTISPGAALAAVLLYTVIQQLENNLLVPKVLGDAVELHPAVMIISLVVGGALFGIGGAILAAPTVAAGRDLYRYAYQRLRDASPEVALAVALREIAALPAAPPAAAPERPPGRCRQIRRAGAPEAEAPASSHAGSAVPPAPAEDEINRC